MPLPELLCQIAVFYYKVSVFVNNTLVIVFGGIGCTIINGLANLSIYLIKFRKHEEVNIKRMRLRIIVFTVIIIVLVIALLMPIIFIDNAARFDDSYLVFEYSKKNSIGERESINADLTRIHKGFYNAEIECKLADFGDVLTVQTSDPYVLRNVDSVQIVSLQYYWEYDGVNLETHAINDAPFVIYLPNFQSGQRADLYVEVLLLAHSGDKRLLMKTEHMKIQFVMEQ